MTKRGWLLSLIGVFAISMAGVAARLKAAVPGGGAPTTSVEVAAGCEAPAFSPSRQAHYVDPLHGNASGDGSRAHPWGTLQDVLSTKMARVHAGDVVYLESGNHGAVLASADNDGFIEVAAAPGQTPVLRSLEITGSRWLFSNLKLRSVRGVGAADYGHALIEVKAGAKPANNIIIRGADIAPSDDAAAWSPGDWLAKGLTGVNIEGGTDGNFCIALTRSTIRYTGGAPSAGGGSAIQFHADRSLLAGNTIDHFADDAIDYGGDDITIRDNAITNNVGLDDGNHNDAIQGYVPGGERYSRIRTYHHLAIRDNLIIRQTDPQLHQPISMQGIDNFGSRPTDWYDVEVTGNVVISNAYHGITFGAVHHLVIAYNTVLADDHGTSQLVDGRTGPVSVPGNQIWVMVQDQLNHLVTEGGASSDVLVSRNITQSLQILSSSAVVKDNIAFSAIALASGGVVTRYKNPGLYGDNNLLRPTLVHDFEDFHPRNYKFDLRVTNGSPLDGKGAASCTRR